jgi:hypothetical protein
MNLAGDDFAAAASRLPAKHFTPTISAKYAVQAVAIATLGFIAAYIPATQLSTSAPSILMIPRIKYLFMKRPSSDHL